jgi:hypothetical protein
MQLVVLRRSKPRNWDRVRVAPECFGRVVAEIARRRYLVDVSVRDVEVLLARSGVA